MQELRLGLNPRTLGTVIKAFGEDTAGDVYVVTDSGGSTGGQIFRIVSIPAAPGLLNVSTRGNVQYGDNRMIADSFSAEVPRRTWSCAPAVPH